MIWSVSSMADDLSVVNVVATGNLPTDINYSKVIDEVELSVVQYDPSIHQGLELRFVEEGPLITVYNTGKYIIRADSFEKLNDTRGKFLELMQSIGIITVAEDEEFNTNNVVCTGGISQELDLGKLAPDLSGGESQYDPEIFPGIQYEPHSVQASVLIFRSGKIVVTGAESFENSKKAYEDLVEQIESLLQK
jgi:transcription initiation factor TFIID TATA-box-binding protein